MQYIKIDQIKFKYNSNFEITVNCFVKYKNFFDDKFILNILRNFKQIFGRFENKIKSVANHFWCYTL